MSGLISVIVPTLDEEMNLPRCLAALAEAGVGEEFEVVVSDGGSSDRTVALATDAGARVVLGPAGRGIQLATGVASSCGEILLFLHADTTLPAGALRSVRMSLSRPGTVGGAFRLGFNDPRWRFRLAETLARFRQRLLGSAWGDQAQFCSRSAYEACGGFPDWPILEDVELARRLSRLGRLEQLREQVTTSARRYHRGGLIATTLRHQVILVLYALGVAPQKLVKLRAPREQIDGSPRVPSTSSARGPGSSNREGP